MAELKPCPFCGGEAAFLGTTCTIKCKQCGGAFIATNPVVARMEIAAAWNRRVAIMWLIDANRLYDTAEEKYMEDRSKTENVITRVMLSQARQKIQELIAYAPSVDAEPVVRCQDCKNFRRNEENDPYCADRRGLSDPEPDGYCSYGERREE